MYIPIGVGSVLLLSTLLYVYQHIKRNRGVDRGDVGEVITNKSISFTNGLYDEFNVDDDIERERDGNNEYEEPVVMENMNNYDIAVNGEDTENIYYVAS
jgi:hypothetical protein